MCKKSLSLMRGGMLTLFSHLPGISIQGVLPDLAPASFSGCRGITGPVPPPLWMSGRANAYPYDKNFTTKST